ncbi:hypothetical protein PybrP1_010408, partial [[Pythium] brassicae (nom. inval.)]
TSSERGQLFRQRQRQREEDLTVIVIRLREQRILRRPTSDIGSLVLRAREFYTVFRHGLETLDPVAQQLRTPHVAELVRASVERKERYLRHAVDPDVVYGSLVGVHALLDQWRKHTSCYSSFTLEVGDAECLTTTDGSASPVVVLRTRLHARFSLQGLAVMFPQSEKRPDLIARFVDKPFTFDCATWFQFSESGRIVIYNVQVNVVEALVAAVGSAPVVAELAQLSTVTPDYV